MKHYVMKSFCYKALYGTSNVTSSISFVLYQKDYTIGFRVVKIKL